VKLILQLERVCFSAKPVGDQFKCLCSSCHVVAPFTAHDSCTWSHRASI